MLDFMLMSLALLRSNNTIGIMCAIGASVCFSTTDVTIKFLSDAYALHQIILLRSAIGMAAMLMILLASSGGLQSLKTTRLARHLIRGIRRQLTWPVVLTHVKIKLLKIATHLCKSKMYI